MDYVFLVEAVAKHRCLLDLNYGGHGTDEAWENVVLAMGTNKAQVIRSFRDLQKMMDEKGERYQNIDDMIQFAYDLPTKSSGVRNEHITMQVEKYPEFSEARMAAMCRRSGPIVIPLSRLLVLGPAPVMPEEKEDTPMEVELLAENEKKTVGVPETSAPQRHGGDFPAPPRNGQPGGP